MLKLGEIGTGLLPNAENGVFGDILITIGQEELGFGLTINPTVTVEKFEHLFYDFYIVLDLEIQSLFFLVLNFHFHVKILIF